MQLKENHKLKAGKYSVVRVLGQGGFGITYLALDTANSSQVAIKEFFPRDYCGRYADGRLSMGNSHTAQIVETLRRRFYKEASNLSHLNHPNIVKIHEVFDENDTTYIVMDYIEGDTLQTIVRDQGPLSEPKASKYIHGVGAALEYIHSQNVTHFDVKPSNIIVRRFDDRPILIDFGFSKEYNGPGDENTKTPPAVSPGYSAMELYNSATFVPFSPQSDIYSLGATLFYLLVGQAPPSPGEILEYGYNLPDAISSDMRAAIDTALKIPRSQRTDKVNDIIALLPAPEPDVIKPEIDYGPTGSSSHTVFSFSVPDLDHPDTNTIYNDPNKLRDHIVDLEERNRKLTRSSRLKRMFLFALSIICIASSSLYIYGIYMVDEERHENMKYFHALKSISYIQPLFVKNISFSFDDYPWSDDVALEENPTYIKFRIETVVADPCYYGAGIAEEKNLNIKFYGPRPRVSNSLTEYFSYTCEILMTNDWHDIGGWNFAVSPPLVDKEEVRYLTTGVYRVEIWYGEKCIASRSFHFPPTQEEMSMYNTGIIPAKKSVLPSTAP